MTFFSVEYYIIRGVQGRYFIALLPALGLFIASLYAGGASGKEEESADFTCTKKIKGEYSRLTMVVVPQLLLVINMIVIVDIYKFLLAN